VLNEDALSRALATAGLVGAVRWDDVTTSTNETAMRMASAGASEWTLVAAGHQTRGRGRHGRAWVDRPGRALMCSVVLRPTLEPVRLGLVSLAAGAAMAEAATAASGRTVRCKWPNDLIAEDAKVGGILAESEVEGTDVRHVVVGVGVNLEAPDDVAGAGAIGPVDEEALLAGFLARLRSLLTDGDAIRQRWRAVSDTIGRPVEATRVDGEAVRGIAADVDETGALVIEAGGSRFAVASGEVQSVAVNEG
jgi:BirA family biotin operon repressor/biotin-[acetyl-CoA-carboxylase] ligase